MILSACWDEGGVDSGTSPYDITAIAIDPVTRIEIEEDDIGDDDGICETGEDCYPPGRVVYLATGDLTSGDLAAGGDGVYKSTDGGMTWRRIVSGLLDLTVRDVVVDLFDPNTVYAGTEGGVYRSSNGGEDWGGFPLPGSGAGITAIVIDRNSCNTIGLPCQKIYAASESVGVFRSTNGGLDLEPLTGISEQAVKSLAIHPPLYLPGQCDDVLDQENCPPLFDTTTVYAGTEGGHVFLFDTAAEIWREDSPPLSESTIQEVLSLAVDPFFVPPILYAGLRNESGEIDNLYRSIGRIWINVVVPGTLLDSVHVVDLAMAPDENNVNVLTIYVGISGLSKSTDGVKWDPINNGLDKTVLSLAIDPLDPNIMFAGSFNSRLFKTVDGGQTWDSIKISF